MNNEALVRLLVAAQVWKAWIIPFTPCGACAIAHVDMTPVVSAATRAVFRPGVRADIIVDNHVIEASPSPSSLYIRVGKNSASVCFDSKPNGRQIHFSNRLI
jgi:hypothetical protein